PAPPRSSELPAGPSVAPTRPASQGAAQGSRAIMKLDVDGTNVPYNDQSVWAGISLLNGLPATTMPVGRTEGGLPGGVQIIGGYLEDKTTIAFAGLIEREFRRLHPAACAAIAGNGRKGSAPDARVTSLEWLLSALCSRWLTTPRIGENSPNETFVGTP